MSDRRASSEAVTNLQTLGGLVPSLSEGVIGTGTELFTQVCRLGLEGVMAKRLTSRYRPGRRTGAWLKIKPPPNSEPENSWGIDWSSGPG